MLYTHSCNTTAIDNSR